ncbi:MAG: HAMP domain-containing sensor histidine kinase, partial [Deltaproteobacteria bacterium]
ALVTHLRIFTRMDEGKRKEVDINRVVTNAFLLIGKALADESVNVVKSLGLVPPVSGSEGRLEQVVINLASNARDAMAPCGGILTITTALVEKHGACFVELCVADTGRGMNEEVASKIFDPFFTTKEPGKGTGLGLTISSGIIKEHGGSISAESVPGKGTTVRVLIPSAH